MAIFRFRGKQLEKGRTNRHGRHLFRYVAMAFKKKIFEDDLRLMAELRAEGLTYSEISEKFDVSEQAVHRALKIAGLHKIPGPFSARLNRAILRIEKEEGRPISEVLAECASLRYSTTFTADLLNVSQKTVARLADHYGVEFPDKFECAGYGEPVTGPAIKAAALAKLKKKGITHNGVTRSADEWSRLLGGGRGLVRSRLRNGWTVEDAVTTPAMTRGFRARKKGKYVKPGDDHFWRHDSWGRKREAMG